MFKNIGKKIQGCSKLVFVIEVIFAVMAGVLAGSIVSTLIWDEDAQSLAGGVALLVIAAGIFIAWLSQMRLYAYGKITESCEIMMKTLERMEAMQTSQIPARKCSNCGSQLDMDAVFCPDCGTKNEK
ncbi:MAG: zinc ribbon domain-containing protein [Peptococcaceae bacterium]|nr:zinc ribbon domain-containing protein [Peptococcaceae bacterium]